MSTLLPYLERSTERLPKLWVVRTGFRKGSAVCGCGSQLVERVREPRMLEVQGKKMKQQTLYKLGPCPSKRVVVIIHWRHWMNLFRLKTAIWMVGPTQKDSWPLYTTAPMRSWDEPPVLLGIRLARKELADG